MRYSARAECSGTILLGQNCVLPFGTLLGQSVPARFCLDRIVFGRLALCSGRVFGHASALAELLFGCLALYSGRVFGYGSALAESCSGTVLLRQNRVRPSGTLLEQNRVRSSGTLLEQSVRARFCSGRIVFGRLALCWGRVFGHGSARSEWCSAVWHSAPARFCSGRIVFGQQSVRARFCSGRILFGSLALCSSRVFGHDSARAESCSFLRVPFAINAFEQEIFKFQTSLLLACDTTSSFLSFLGLENMSESSVSVSFSEENIVISSSSSLRSDRVSTSRSEVGTSNPQLSQPSSSEPLPPSSSEPPQPSTSQPSPSLPVKNALGDVKDQAEDEANPKPWYTADEKSSKMSTEDLLELLREHPLPEGWYARLPGLQEPTNYGTKFETGIYEEQVKSGYRLPLHPFALRFFEHYHMAPGQLVPNGWRKLVELIYLVQTSGYKPDAKDFMRVFFKICFVKGVANYSGSYYIHSRQRLLKGGPKSNNGWHSRYFFVGRSDKGKLPFDREWNPYFFLSMYILVLIPNSSVKMASGSGKATQGGFLGVLKKAKGKRKKKKPSAEFPPTPKKTRVIPPDHSPQIVEKVSVDEDPIFRPRWTIRCDDVGMPDSQISEQHLVHGVFPRDNEVFQNQTHETFACSFAQAVQVSADKAQQKREAIKEAEEATRRAEELSKQETDYLAQIETLERRLEQAKRRVAEEKRADDGLEIYELGFAKAKEMFAEHFPDIPLDDLVLPTVISPSGKTVLPSEAGYAAASHPLGEGPSGDAP
ncbi:hypothetical protein RJ639_038173 [Escallonia herrerae]|uniref:Transposase (putative) gypsy type domain-containing protein n=1 Tax=Escallonia herrerae TaxID=1293975 RepID=A0AA88X093_9ASTE|nr:hypothetical protein RJ639_038173 [Escallonia herrerae]